MGPTFCMVVGASTPLSYSRSSAGVTANLATNAFPAATHPFERRARVVVVHSHLFDRMLWWLRRL
jgi:hypothetical protein